MNNQDHVGPEQMKWRRYIIARTKTDPVTGCWIWQGSKDRFGYGTIGRKTTGKWRPHKAHRVAFEAFKGSPGEMCVLHLCDVPQCANPRHLKLGTKADNTADMIRKGREVHGVDHHAAILDEAKVREVRSLTQTHTDTSVAKRYGVSITVIRKIRLGQTWKHVK